MTLIPKITSKPKLAVYKFSSCDGCQLSLLNMEDEILELTDVMDIAYFIEATSTVKAGPYDIGLVEGSVSTPHEAERIKEVRDECKVLVTIGTCATAGGIQALRNFDDADDYAMKVYKHPEFLHYLDTSTPISLHVTVDFEVWGCPVNKTTVLEVLAAILQNRKPIFPPSPVCVECKRRGIVCVVIAQGITCLGPVVHGGCGALCPANGRGCYGCFGPSSNANFNALLACMLKHDKYTGETAGLLRSFSSYAPAFKRAAEEAQKNKPN